MARTTRAAEPEIFLSLGLEGSPEAPKVLTLVASAIEGMVRRGDFERSQGKKRGLVTMFHGSRPPSVSIRNYIERIYKYGSCSPACFVTAFIYIQRYMKRTEALITKLNVHRLLITGVMVAVKFMDDGCYNNAYYAKIGGVSVAEINKLELKFLFDLDFGLYVTKEMFSKQCEKLERRHGRDSCIKRRIHGGREPRQESSNTEQNISGGNKPSSSCEAM